MNRNSWSTDWGLYRAPTEDGTMGSCPEVDVACDGWESKVVEDDGRVPERIMMNVGSGYVWD